MSKTKYVRRQERQRVNFSFQFRRRYEDKKDNYIDSIDTGGET